MIVRYPKTAGPGGPGIDERSAEPRAGAGKDDDCRCKAASEMSPGELFKLMVSDLAFWKKGKPKKSLEALTQIRADDIL
jgi:hypothetical protein